MEVKNKEQLFKELGSLIRVEDLNGYSNQFRMVYKNGEVFQSYKSIIAIELKHDDRVYLSNHWDYSRTTARHRNYFLSKDTKKIKEDLKNGVAVIVENLV